jgi:hypothetical protein
VSIDRLTVAGLSAPIANSFSIGTSGPLGRVERARMRYAVEDWAGNYARFSGDPARYITEGHLRDEYAHHGYETVYQAVRTYLERHPNLVTMTTTAEERHERAKQRKAASIRLGDIAVAAIDAGDFERALRLVDDAEELAPGLQPWDQIRGVIRARHDSARRASELPA